MIMIEIRVIDYDYISVHHREALFKGNNKRLYLTNKNFIFHWIRMFYKQNSGYY